MSMKRSLNLFACGHVGDGKSTLLRRLLFEIGAMSDHQIEKATTKGKLDCSFVADGLADARSLVISADVRYRSFRHKGRGYRLADAPGNVPCTRQMAVAAADSDVALMLVDATQGVRDGTTRHSRIAAFLGVRNFVIIVNKMDLVGFDETIFERISSEFCYAFNRDYIGDDNSIGFIPVCAIAGDNVTRPSARMRWYRGPTLLESLEEKDVASKTERGVRLPIQSVADTKDGRRGYQGQLTGGNLAAGDQLRATGRPRGVVVKALYHDDAEVNQATNGDSITLIIDDDLALAPGSVLFAGQAPMHMLSEFPAKVLWIKADPQIQTNVRAVLKIHARDAEVEVENCGGMGYLTSTLISARASLPIDAFETNNTTGLFVLTDQGSEDVIGVGAVEKLDSSASGGVIDYCI